MARLLPSASHLCGSTLRAVMDLLDAEKCLLDYRLKAPVTETERLMLARYVRAGISPADAAERVQVETWASNPENPDAA